MSNDQQQPSRRTTWSVELSCTIKLALISLALISCADELDQSASPAYHGHSVAWDLQEDSEVKGDGLVSRFDQDWLMSDAFFTNYDALTVEGMQAFLELSPYEHRSWLADYLVDGVPASRRLIEIAHELKINPLLLLSRMQVEQGLVSKKERPSQRSLDSALGCGCPDNRSCYESYQGFSKQLECAGLTLRKLYDESVEGRGLWNAGQSRLTLEGITVRPANHATAALYAYTPWVLRGRGGNWLVWNITNKFAQYLSDRSLLRDQGGDSSCLYQSGRAFIGDPCACELDCAFWVSGQLGSCHEAGFCTIPCAGGCPDLSGEAPTFCVEDPYAPGSGVCMAQAHDENGHCADLPNTLDVKRPRFIGDSNSLEREALVCAPRP